MSDTCECHDLTYSLYAAAVITALFKRFDSFGENINATILHDIVQQFSFFDSFLITCLEISRITNIPSEPWTIEEFDLSKHEKHLLNVWARYQQILGRDLPDGVSEDDFGPIINEYFKHWFIDCFMLWHERGYGDAA